MDVSIHCPISSNVCLTFIPKQDLENKFTNNMTCYWRPINKFDVDKINELTAHQIDRFLYCGDKEELEKHTEQFRIMS